MFFLEKLPDELWLNIFRFLDYKYVKRALLVIILSNKNIDYSYLAKNYVIDFIKQDPVLFRLYKIYINLDNIVTIKDYMIYYTKMFNTVCDYKYNNRCFTLTTLIINSIDDKKREKKFKNISLYKRYIHNYKYEEFNLFKVLVE